MKHGKILKILFYLALLTLLFLIGYKVYLNFFESDNQALHYEQIRQIKKRLATGDTVKFAVVGNINNSIGIFERRIIPRLNEGGFDFVVSAGNAVSGGGADKYRALQGALEKLDMPYLLTFGEEENEGMGGFHFYNTFGPHFFSVKAAGTRLIFLDSTGKTSWRWQVRWLKEILDRDDSSSRFLFMGHPVIRPDHKVPFAQREDYLQPQEFRESLLETVHRYGIDIVFSANLSLFSDKPRQDTRFITTGGAGGMVLNDETSFYHFVGVEVDEEGEISHEVYRLDIGQHPLFKKLESLWLVIHSLVYAGYLNFILLVCVLLLVTIKLYTKVFVEKEYYPDYNFDRSRWLYKPLSVAMFTNNYLPFYGGVPVSVDRLRRGLSEQADHVLVVAPQYHKKHKDEEQVLRVPSFLALGKKREFRLPNIFLRSIRRQVKNFNPDVIHVHHPFGLGSLGLFMARRLNVPAVYTYHTRLEEYAHFVPLPDVLFRNLISHALVKRFANKCNATIVPTFAIGEYLRLIGVTTPVYVQPSGIDYERFQHVDEEQVQAVRRSFDIADDEFVFISVSRLSNEKNIDFMIDAVDVLRRQTSRNFRLVMIGDGVEHERLQQRINHMNLREYFVLAGAVPPEDMPVWYSAGDIFLFASKSETQGLVVMEAMAAGLPVVAVRSSGVDNIIEEGVTGFKTAENREEWSSRVQQLLEDESLRKKLGSNAEKTAREFSVEKFAQNVREIYITTFMRMKR